MKSFKSDAQIEIRVLDVAELNDVAGGCYGTPGYVLGRPVVQVRGPGAFGPLGGSFDARPGPPTRS